ncbi:maleylpyruvate isomerase family mycothiol-dependent enzyme [uncultured Mycobacterium sp.]|uniref:maleylpyruvate isomerase family mycothiol-dependent enzyme n=1 Tax=uncultured Mycobacterium sp. TaxID=171292 RepID=UPI0035CA4985
MRSPADHAADLRDQSATALAAKLRSATDSIARLLSTLDDTGWRAPSSVPGLTVGQGVHTLLSDAYIHGDDIRAAFGQGSDRGPGLCASLDWVLGALARDDAATADSHIARLLTVPAAAFRATTGIDEHDFLLAATGRFDAARLNLPEIVNIYR